MSEKPYVEYLMEAILDYAAEHEDFDAEFVEDVQYQYERSGSVSDKQLLALQRIADGFDIRV
jgi:hypothetical protein